MFHCFLQQVFGGVVIGMHPHVERRVAQNRVQTHGRGVDAVAGNHFPFQTVGRQGQTAAGGGEGGKPNPGGIAAEGMAGGKP